MHFPSQSNNPPVEIMMTMVALHFAVYCTRPNNLFPSNWLNNWRVKFKLTKKMSTNERESSLNPNSWEQIFAKQSKENSYHEVKVSYPNHLDEIMINPVRPPFLSLSLLLSSCSLFDLGIQDNFCLFFSFWCILLAPRLMGIYFRHKHINRIQRDRKRK